MAEIIITKILWLDQYLSRLALTPRTELHWAQKLHFLIHPIFAILMTIHCQTIFTLFDRRAQQNICKKIFHLTWLMFCK